MLGYGEIGMEGFSLHVGEALLRMLVEFVDNLWKCWCCMFKVVMRALLSCW